MTPTEKELIQQKFQGVYAMIQASNDIQAEVNNKIMDKLDRIEIQTTKTNGRVGTLENFKWKIVGIAIGSGGIISAIITVIWS